MMCLQRSSRVASPVSVVVQNTDDLFVGKIVSFWGYLHIAYEDITNIGIGGSTWERNIDYI
jgi:glucose-6-phosphate isomerase